MDRRLPILAVLYSDSLKADRALSELGYQLRAAGVAVAGLVQLNSANPDRDKCDMNLEELSSGTVLRMSEDRGRHARGCRLDHAALAEAAALLSAALDRGPELVIVNKFGKQEAGGGGLRDALAQAVQLGIPIVVGVPYRNVEQWRLFAGATAEECEIDAPHWPHWLQQLRARSEPGRAPVAEPQAPH